MPMTMNKGHCFFWIQERIILFVQYGYLLGYDQLVDDTIFSLVFQICQLEQRRFQDHPMSAGIYFADGKYFIFLY
jgi:hypothetical protein